MSEEEPNQIAELLLPVRLTKADLYRASFLNAIRSKIFWIAPLGIGFIVANLLGNNPYRWYATVFAVLSYVFLVPYGSARTSAKNPGVLAPITYSLSDAGVSAQYVNGATVADWSLVLGAFESSRYVFIKMQRGSFHLVPKAQVGAQDFINLRQILREKLGKKASVL